MDGNVIIKAVLDTVDVSKNIKALERDLQGISWKNITEGDEKAAKLSSSFKKAGTAATVTLTAPVVAAGKAVFGVASDYEQANARIAAAFGVSGEEAERFSGIGKRIYEGGWGQSLDEVNDALIQCKSTLRDVSDEDLQTVTTNALMLSDTFGADVNESIRGTNALMEGFGLSATEASDLLTAGMQRGLNYTDELGDNLSEYSVRWGEAGMSASEYFSLLEAGTSNGAYNLDKVGDYLNEFLTALSDGRMEESIGSFSEGTQEVFENFKNGSATAEDMLQAVLGDLTQMPNEYDKAALASTLWSSLGEDNAMGMIKSLAGVQDSFGDVAGAAQQAQEAASDSFAVKSQEAMRELQGSIEPLGEPLLNIATNVAGVVKSFSEWFAGIGEGGQTAVLAIAAIVAAIGPVLSTVGTVISVVPQIGAAFAAVGKAGTAALGLIAAHPVIAFIALIVAAVVTLWNTNEDFRNACEAAWSAISGFVAQAVGQMQPALEALATFFTAGVLPALQSLADGFVQAFTGILNGAVQFASGLLQAVQGGIQLVQGVCEAVLGVIVGIFTGKWDLAKSGAEKALNGLLTGGTGILNAMSGAISGILSGISGLFTGIFSGIKSTASSALSAVSGFFEDKMGGAKQIVKGALDSISGFFSGCKLQLPHIKLPHFSISGDFSLNPPSVPHFGIDWYAKGGVFNGPSVIGVGEAGPEGVVPFNERGARPLAEGIAKLLDGKGGAGHGDTNVTINMYATVREEADIEKISRQIAKEIKRQECFA